MIEAKIIGDSVSAEGKRLTTMQLAYPRFIHSEFMTHRAFSRNASSSRAIPVEKMIAQVRNSPAMPTYWGKNQKGMQAGEQLTGQPLEDVQGAWTRAACLAANIAEEMAVAGLHKQIANRITEPFQTIHVVVTATEWDNFFELRDHPDAQPEIQALAGLMRGVMRAAGPEYLATDEWHLPYVTGAERGWMESETLRKVSAARCARVSYLNHNKEHPDVAEDLRLYERLVGSKPYHASPVEHQAMPDARDSKGAWMSRHLHGNFVGWIQNRKLLGM